MAATSDKLFDINKAEELFEQFIKDHNKTYKDEEDKKIHYEAFTKNLEKINRLNSQPNQTATYGINKFADYTEDEMKCMHGGRH
ncbi:cathepsin propeptide inhibitor domain (I29) domain-containing protein [Phthorimaea operculella]|nr:cathepsin propeptide inhibitor domain (I29) domain-containing protein [Phthorimaea operculella]